MVSPISLAVSLASLGLALKHQGVLVSSRASTNLHVARHINGSLIDHSIEERGRHGKTFYLNGGIRDEALFSGRWETPPLNIPIPGSPFSVEANEVISLALACIECRTFGDVVAELKDSMMGIDASLTFNNVGAYVNLALLSSSKGIFSIDLGGVLGRNLDVKGDKFGAKVSLGLSLNFEMDAAVQMTGGFQLSIRDGSQVGFGIALEADTDNDKLDVNAHFEKTAPEIDLSLLPLVVNNTKGCVTISLVLHVDADISAKMGLVSGDLGAGASLTIAEVSFCAAQNATCPNALSVDFDSHAGAYAVAAASVGGIGGGLNINGGGLRKAPEVSTTFLAAGTTTCLGTNTAPSMPGAMSASTTAVWTGPACPSGVPGIVTTKNVTSTYSLTTCLASAADCPAPLTQVIVVTDVTTVVTTVCPTPTASSTFTGVFFTDGRPSTTPPPTSPSPFPAPGALNITALPCPVTSAVDPAVANFSGSINQTVVTGAFAPLLSPPEARTTSSSVASAATGAPSQSGNGGPVLASGKTLEGSSVAALMGVMLGVLVML